jgi:hypothetical protein
MFATTVDLLFKLCPLQVIVDLLFQLYPLKQPLLSRHATEALAALCDAQTSHMSPATLAQILMVRGVCSLDVPS